MTAFYGSAVDSVKGYQSSSERDITLMSEEPTNNILTLNSSTYLKNLKAGLPNKYPPYLSIQLIRHLYVPIARETWRYQSTCIIVYIKSFMSHLLIQTTGKHNS